MLTLYKNNVSSSGVYSQIDLRFIDYISFELFHSPIFLLSLGCLLLVRLIKTLLNGVLHLIEKGWVFFLQKHIFYEYTRLFMIFCILCYFHRILQCLQIFYIELKNIVIFVTFLFFKRTTFPSIWTSNRR